MFSKTDTVTDSETFYNSILDFLEESDEQEEVSHLLTWWNRYVISLGLFNIYLIYVIDRSSLAILRHDLPLPKTVLWPGSERSARRSKQSPSIRRIRLDIAWKKCVYICQKNNFWNVFKAAFNQSPVWCLAVFMTAWRRPCMLGQALEGFAALADLLP